MADQARALNAHSQSNDAGAYESGDMRGAHLHLAQRHRKIAAGDFRGRRRFEPEIAAPGVVGLAALSFTTSGFLPQESRITCVLPDHGWAFAATNGINAVLKLPQGIPTSSLKTLWLAATRTLEFTLLDQGIPAGTAVILLISGAHTPAVATPAAEAIVTSFEKLVVRETVPPSTRGGQIIDGPTTFSIPTIAPGELTGQRKWQPFSCCPGAVSDVALGFVVHGRIPANGKILVELPPDGWDMADAPKVLLRSAQYHNALLQAVWQRHQHTLEIQLGACALASGTSIVVTVVGVKNPDKETMNSNAAAAAISTAARVTTLVANGGIIDGPTKIDVARISELKESDFLVAMQAFDELDADRTGVLTVEKLPEVLRRTGVVLSTELFESLVAANLPVRVDPGELPTEPQEVPASSPTQPQTITREQFLNLFAQVYAPAYKYGQMLRLSCGRGEVDRIREYISRGCDPNAKDGSGWAALHYAADFGQLEALRTIIDSIAVVNASLVGKTLAVDLNLRDTSGWTPLLCAAANGHTQIVETLLALGADLAIASAEGRSAVHWAAIRGMDACLSTLLAAGAEKDAADRSGWTPLHCAVLHGSTSCVQLLRDSGADSLVKDKLQYTCADYDAQSVPSPSNTTIATT